MWRNTRLPNVSVINGNIFKFENRLNSQISRFLDKSPVFVTYFHINVNETTVDGGFKDIEDIVGNRSPLKFQKIENFPIYGLEPVVLSKVVPVVIVEPSA